MKLSFSTNGWQLSWSEFVRLAKEFGFKGIEIHDVNSPQFDAEAPFAKQNVSRTLRRLNENKINVCCIDATANLCDAAMRDDVVAEIERLINLAKLLNCPNIRLHAYKTAEAASEAEDGAAVAVIEKVLPIAVKNNVVLLVESMGLYADSNRLASLLNKFACDNLCALWDIHHTVRYGGENVEDTIKNLGAYVKHVHVKDSICTRGEVRYKLMGEGNLPIKDVLLSLRSINYENYLSLELQPKWIEDFADVNIVFPQYASYMSVFNTEKTWSGRHFKNNRGTGEFIWEKETLIDKTFSQVLDNLVAEFPDQLAFKYTTLDYTRTYSEFRDDVDAFAKSLIALGVKPGDKVACWATNVPEWYISFWAAAKIGAILVTVNTAYKIHELEYLLKQSDAHTLVMVKEFKDSNYKQIINELVPELASHEKAKPLHSARLPFLRYVITVGFSQEGSLTFAEANKLGEQVPIDEVYRRAAAVGSHDVCNMQYTSGTTGFPKGVMLTHYSVVNNGKCIGDRMDLSTADRMMIQVPMFHCFGMVLAMTATMTHGGTVLPLPYFSPKPALNCINQERITCFHGVPTMFIAMLNHADFAKTDFSYMRTGIMAGSPCPIAVMQDVVKRMNMTEITIVYGLTEASPGCTMSCTTDSLEVRVETVGRPLPSIECKIINPETGDELPDNQIGEFVARGYNIMKGYYKMPKETAQAIDADGWLHSGDLALRTPEGYYRITGRLKDMIIRGGENIYPKELEDFIYTHPKVSDVQVVGVKDEQYGEECYAYVILKKGEELTAAELKQYMVERVAKHKVPKYVEFVDGFPTNAAGKILKYKMREMAEQKLNAAK